jgi:hypothetical protein
LLQEGFILPAVGTGLNKISPCILSGMTTRSGEEKFLFYCTFIMDTTQQL